jgi:predicted acylesterase/phospholipase RssA/CRP-like cAMP-binding protein
MITDVEQLLAELGVVSGSSQGMGTHRILQEGEVLIREEDSARGVFLLIDGVLVVSRLVDGEPVHLATFDTPGSVLGEITTLAGGVRTASVRAATPSRVVELTSSELEKVLASRPEVAQSLAALALQRAEETEFTELLASHFGILEEETLSNVRAAAEWKYLSAGDLLFTQGDPSDAICFVLRGRLRVERVDPDGTTEVVGTVGQGEVVGELGVIQETPRSANVTALRDTVVAMLDEKSFFTMLERHPRVLTQLGMSALARAGTPRGEARPRVLALLISPNLNHGYVTGLTVGELESWGSVAVFAPQLVDDILGASGAFDARPGEVGDLPLSKLLHQAELENDVVVLVLSKQPGPWARRCMGMADRLVVVLPADPADEDVEHARRFLGDSPRFVPPVLVLAHGHGAKAPRDSALAAEKVGAVGVLHVRQGPTIVEDVARVARVVAGRGYALVLGGGGGRGFAHIGVRRALDELGIPVDIIGGSSIGGILSFVMADELGHEEMASWARRQFSRVLDYTIPIVALTKGGSIVAATQEAFGDRLIEDLWRTSFAVSTDLTTSRVVVHRNGRIDHVIRATSAIPGVIPPVPHGDSLLVDGGVLNNLPVDIARQMAPAGVVIASDVAPPRGPRAHRDYGLSVSGWEALRARLRGKKTGLPGISSVMLRSMIVASMRQRDSHLSADIVDCYLDLDMRGVGMLDFDDPETVAQRGYEVAMPILERWLEDRAASAS